LEERVDVALEMGMAGRGCGCQTCVFKEKKLELDPDLTIKNIVLFVCSW
jgi:hypothetical protein